ncbi:Bug family tripartite tricarboxylate transporter substrate binding protein [Azohydromonas sediminis]|uniref:Bug family tripartite tricarboxylate transporter substrate binding protein n=1 Tax=Azohydromonas sediminis TaxID=2259674 RepID=UPI000E64D741|nr:tripartite tricarboxylate transporter substrate binding protein [Azohydromonas sediminis]
MDRRRALKSAAAGAAACAAPWLARAQSWPSKPVTWVYPYAAGGGADPLARALAAIVGPRLGQQIVVDNRTGAAGMIGATAVARAPADGYTFLFCVSSEIAINQWLYKNMTYDPEVDLVPVCRLTTLPFALVSSLASRLGSVAEVVAAAKASPDKLTFGHPGSGTLQHIAGELLQRAAGIRFTQVPYKGIAAVTTDVLGGHVDLALVGLSTALPHVRAARMHGLGLSSAAPVPGVPELAPLARQDPFRSFDVLQWFGMMAPKGTPPPIVERMQAELSDALRLPAMAAQLASQGLTSAFLPAGEFGAFIAGERAKYERVIKEANITTG